MLKCSSGYEEKRASKLGVLEYYSVGVSALELEQYSLYSS